MIFFYCYVISLIRYYFALKIILLVILGMVESKRRIKDEITIEQRYYLMSIESNARRFAESIRSHWGIENQLHWVLDVGFHS